MITNPAASHRNAPSRSARTASRLKAGLASLSLALGGSAFLLGPAPVQAQEVISASPDITIELGAGVVATDHDVALDNQLGIVLLDDLGPLPETVDVIGLAQDGAGNRLIALDTATLLEDGVGGEFVARAGDIVTYDGAGYSLTFDAAAAGIPSGVNTDAAALNLSGLLLSFDTTVDLGAGLYAADEDLVLWDGSAFSMALDGSAAGLDRALDLDAGHALGGGAYLVSFDTSGEVGGIAFQDEDLLRYAGGVWSLELDASTLDADWGPADLDAVQVPEPAFGLGLLLGCLLLGWTVSPWSSRREMQARRAGAAAVRLKAASLGAAGGLVTLGVLGGVAQPASAADGVYEINQTCATQTGCFFGDSAGFPVTIPVNLQGQSFRLTSDLTVPAAFGGIEIAVGASDVAIDLNEHSLISEACVGTYEDCTGASFDAARSGIQQLASGATEGVGVTVKDGRVFGFPGYGVRLGDYAQVRNVDAKFNSGNGVRVHAGSIVTDTRAERNGQTGILICCQIAGGSGSVVTRTKTRFNTNAGIKALSSVVLSDSIAEFNSEAGFRTVLASVVVENIARQNSLGGFDGSGVSVYRKNVAEQNFGPGLRASPSGGANLVTNVSVSNSVAGLSIAGQTSAYRENVMRVNSGAQVTGGANLGDNLCNGSVFCP